MFDLVVFKILCSLCG